MNKDQIKPILEKFQSKKVIVIGDFYLDEYVYTKSDKLSPEASVPRAVVQSVEHVPGAAGNVANMFAALGAKVTTVGVIGNDHTGSILRDQLKAKGIDTSGLVIDSSRVTGTLSRVMIKGPNGFQHVIRVDYENEKVIGDSTKEGIIEMLQNNMKDADAIFVADYDEVGTGIIKQDLLKVITTEAAKQNVMTVGISRGHITNMQNFDVLVGNELEIELATGKKASDNEELSKLVEDLKQRLNNKVFIVTRAEKGLIAYGDTTESLPTIAEDVVDVCGAGDALSSTFTVTKLCGATLKEACEIGSAAAAAAVGKPGTATASQNEIEGVLFQDGSVAKSLEVLESILQKVQLQDKKVVLANGYFDFIHGGHVGFLKAAKKFGDILVIAINSDESTKLNKGADHPLIDEKERSKVVASFDFVDYVTIFNDMTPLKIIKELKPDVLVKGGNFTESQVVGADIVKSYGGSVKIIPLEGPTTTKIIEHIRTAKKAIHE